MFQTDKTGALTERKKERNKKQLGLRKKKKAEKEVFQQSKVTSHGSKSWAGCSKIEAENKNHPTTKRADVNRCAMAVPCRW